MSFLFALALVQAASPVSPPPTDWSTLPALQMDRPSTISPQDTVAIMRLVERRPGCRAGIGPMPTPAPAGNVRMEGLRVDFAVLVAPDGRILNILASPGACDAVRNYSRAIVNGRYRERIRPPAGPGPVWYKMSLGFTWEP